MAAGRKGRNMTIISQQIKELRESQALTKTAFAEALGVTVSTVMNYESGKTKPTKKIMEKIKEAYGVSLGEAAAAEPAPAPAAPEPKMKPGRKKAEEKKPEPKKEAKTAAPKKGGAKKKAKDIAAEVKAAEEPVVTEAAPAGPDVKEKKQKKTKPAVPKKAAPKKGKAAPSISIESLLGGKITIEEITAKVLEAAPDAKEVFVKAEENRAYYTAGSGDGFVVLWD